VATRRIERLYTTVYGVLSLVGLMVVASSSTTALLQLTRYLAQQSKFVSRAAGVVSFWVSFLYAHLPRVARSVDIATTDETPPRVRYAPGPLEVISAMHAQR
jgi:hypothetical protein